MKLLFEIVINYCAINTFAASPAASQCVAANNSLPIGSLPAAEEAAD